MSDEPTIEERIAELRQTELEIEEADARIARAQARRAAAAGRAEEASVSLYETTLRESLAAHGVDAETAEALVRARPTSPEEIAREARIDEQRAARPAPTPTLTVEQREAHEAAVRDRLRAGGMTPAEIDAMMAARPTVRPADR